MEQRLDSQTKMVTFDIINFLIHRAICSAQFGTLDFQHLNGRLSYVDNQRHDYSF